MLATLTGTVPGVALPDVPADTATPPHGDPVTDAAGEGSAAAVETEAPVEADDEGDTPNDTPETSEER